ncbi:MAG: DUF3164 family protein, partial [Psychrobacter sp.]|nr:DUF3164 family protein [Psychrobacter sp.]
MSNETQAVATQVPAGYMQNAKGHLIPIDKVKEVDKLRDEVVIDIVTIAKALSEHMTKTKSHIFADFNDFVAVSAQEYDTKVGGEKGNTSLMSYDGKYKVQMAVAENL